MLKCVCVYDNLIDGVMGHNYAFMTKGEFVIVTKRNVETVCTRYGNYAFTQVHSQKRRCEMIQSDNPQVRATVRFANVFLVTLSCLYSSVQVLFFGVNLVPRSLQLMHQVTITSRTCARIADTQPI